MVLKAHLLAAATAAAVIGPPASAHQAPVPLRAMEGGQVKEAGRIRVELVQATSLLTLSFRNQQNDPIPARLESLQRWDDAGLHSLSFETRGHHAFAETDPNQPSFRTFVRIRGADDASHLLVFTPPMNQGTAP